MKKIIAFGTSNSPQSINKQLAVYAANQLLNTEDKVLDLNDYDLPIYSIEFEESHGVPTAAQKFLEHIKSADALVISLAKSQLSHYKCKKFIKSQFGIMDSMGNRSYVLWRFYFIPCFDR